MEVVASWKHLSVSSLGATLLLSGSFKAHNDPSSLETVCESVCAASVLCLWRNACCGLEPVIIIVLTAADKWWLALTFFNWCRDKVLYLSLCNRIRQVCPFKVMWRKWLNGHYSPFPPSPSLSPVCVFSWLVYADPGFGGFVGVLEEGEYPCPEAWGFLEPFVGSLRPLRMVHYMRYMYMFAQDSHLSVVFVWLMCVFALQGPIKVEHPYDIKVCSESCYILLHLSICAVYRNHTYVKCQHASNITDITRALKKY